MKKTHAQLFNKGAERNLTINFFKFDKILKYY